MKYYGIKYLGIRDRKFTMGGVGWRKSGGHNMKAEKLLEKVWSIIQKEGGGHNMK